MAPENAIIRFPAERTGHPARGPATPLDVAGGRLRERLGRFVSYLGIPGAIVPTEIHDQTTGQHIAISVGTLSVCLTVNGRDFYFDRFTGRFTGTGSSVA